MKEKSKKPTIEEYIEKKQIKGMEKHLRKNWIKKSVVKEAIDRLYNRCVENRDFFLNYVLEFEKELGLYSDDNHAPQTTNLSSSNRESGANYPRDARESKKDKTAEKVVETGMSKTDGDAGLSVSKWESHSPSDICEKPCERRDYFNMCLCGHCGKHHSFDGFCRLCSCEKFEEKKE